jgi:alginate O-acetyltransferase complex protein AlgI
MSFLSMGFALFFLAIAGLYFSIPRKLRPGLLLAASLVFYGSMRLSFLALLAVEVLLAYGSALWLARGVRPGRRFQFGLSLAALLTPLFILKYFDFVVQSVAAAAHGLTRGRPPDLLSLALPIGISFYTFKSLSYVIDVFRGRIPPEKSPLPVALYISFFPQILAGPIERAGHFLAELRKDYVFDLSKALSGLGLVLWGLFKKLVIADRLALFVTAVFSRPQNYPDLRLIAGLVFYSFQIYCDFSGYSDIAIGLARILGLETMINFNYPYFSRSISDFWSRWHISLSTWLRDYLFLPISYGLSRRIQADRFLFFKTEYFLYFCGMSVTMLLCGLWHGASWTFVVWGGLHGLYLIVSRATRKTRNVVLRRLHVRTSGPIWSGLRTVFTFSLVTLAWVFFRAPSLGEAWSYLGRLSLARPAGGTSHLLFLAVLLTLFVLAEWVLKNRNKLPFRKPLPVPVRVVAFALAVCLIIVLAADTSSEFLYFQF